MAIAAICFVSCSKDDGGKKKDKDKSDEKTEYVAPITIDGDFADWAALDASKVLTATCADGAYKTALKTAKVYADETYVFVYVQFDGEAIADRSWVPFHFYIDGDANDATGGFFGEQWIDGGVDVLLEGSIFENDFCDYNPGAYAWSGDEGGSGWSWDVDNPLIQEGGGICSGAGKGEEYEIRLVREMYPKGELVDGFKLGIDIQQNWSTVGWLPNVAVTEDNTAGKTNMFVVKTNK